MKIKMKMKDFTPIPPMSEDDNIVYFMIPIHINNCGLLKEVYNGVGNGYSYFLAYSSTNEPYLCSSSYSDRNLKQILEFDMED